MNKLEKMVFLIFLKTLNITHMIELATYESSRIRFSFIKKVIKFSAYRILPNSNTCGVNNASLECFNGESIQASMYYEWLYDVQNVPRNFLGQLVFVTSLVGEAYKMRVLFKKKPKREINLSRPKKVRIGASF